MSKRDIGMLAVTIILVAAFIGVLIYDRNQAVLERTAPAMFYEDDNLELVGMNKQGMMFNRVAYSAKFKVVDGYWEQYFVTLANSLQTEGMFLDSKEFKDYSTKTLTGQRYIPTPTEDSVTWLCGAGEGKSGIICIVDQESDGGAYIYLYYSK